MSDQQQQKQQTLFDIYGVEGLPIELVTLNVLRTIISIIGILFNSSLVFVTAKTKALNSPCHLLIAFDCLVSAWYQLASFLSITVLFGPGHQFIPIRPCCLQILPPFQFGFIASISAMYLISLDRLMSIVFPIWYSLREIKKRYYLLPMLISTLICPAIITYAQYQVVYTVPESTQVICVSHECSWGWAADLIYVIFVSFYVLTLANYIIIWIVLKWHSWKSSNQNLAPSHDWTRRILKTLSIILLLNIIGLTMNYTTRIIVPRLNFNLTQKTITIHGLSCITCLVMSSNAPILFTFNQEYKKAFLSTFKFKSNIKTTKVSPVNSLNNIKLMQTNNKNLKLTPIN
uniref:G-protein coupled receptors family 1 profile domain-containing protein n=1 Tax=Meloidogyne enterolobii TaxID=390850 RepID=A0A6V7UQU6_MELEN|nr:unnamed protein product [Meloidogyne enterolobii]